MRNFDLKLSKQLFLQGNALSNNQVVDLATLFATANPSVSVDIPYTPSPIPVTFTTLASTFVDGFPFAGFVATNGTTTTILGATTEDGNPYAVVETNSGSLTGGMAVTSGGVQLYGASSTGSTTVAITGSDSTINLSGLATFKINDLKSSKTGMQYSSDYSAVLKGIDRSIPDVGTVKVLRQTANTWSTAGRPSSPAAGEFGYNSTTTVHEGWNGTSWNNMGGVTILTATATLDFPSTTAQNNNALTITVTGCAVGDVVILGIPTAAIPATNHVYTAWVSSVNTVSVRFSNNGASTVDPSSGTFTIKVIK